MTLSFVRLKHTDWLYFRQTDIEKGIPDQEYLSVLTSRSSEGSVEMKFCDKCGSYMTKSKEGYVCSKCGNQTKTEIVEVIKIRATDKPTVILDPSKLEYMKVAETCPRCGNNEAFHSLGFISGEHAGVRQERAMERFVCTKCGHSWSKE
jgi:DNA-directed RNA polymerase subunit M/transcription elongation factor TFIIS